MAHTRKSFNFQDMTPLFLFPLNLFHLQSVLHLPAHLFNWLYGRKFPGSVENLLARFVHPDDVVPAF